LRLWQCPPRFVAKLIEAQLLHCYIPSVEQGFERAAVLTYTYIACLFLT